MPHFIENITTSQWGYTLLEEVTQNEVCDAISLIQYISLTCGAENLDSCTLHTQAKCILNSFLILSQNDIMKTLAALVELLEKLDRRFITVSFARHLVNIEILNGDTFGAVLTISISNLLRRVLKNAPDESMLLRIIRSILINLNCLITSSTCIYRLNTLHLLVKNCTDIGGCQQFTFNQMYLFLKRVHCKQAIKVSDEVLGVVIKRMNSKEKMLLFRKANKLLWWDRSECVMIIHLLNYWPVNVDIDAYLREMAPRLASMLLENITDYSMKALRVAISHMNFETWNTVFIPNIVNMISNHFNNNWESITKTFGQCVSLGVQRFEAQVYKEITPNISSTCYPALALHYSIYKGCLNIVDYQYDIHRLIHSPDFINQNYGVKSICVFNNKKSDLTIWHIEQIQFYLESTLFSLEEVCFKELHYFVSHMSVRANRMLQTNGDLKNLDCYVKFVQWLYEFSISGLLSRSLKGVKLGSELFNLIWNTLCSSSQYLKSKYGLDETDHYEQRQSAFLKYLVSINAWNFDNNSTYQVIVSEFLLSEKVFPELCVIIEKWNDVYSSSDPAVKISSETAFTILETKYGKEFVAKAEYCISLALSRASAGCKVGEVLEQWKRVVQNFTRSSLDDTDGIVAVYSFTSFISTLLHKRLIKSSEHSAILECCNRVIRKLVKINFDHSHVTKSIEQTFVTIMNILCDILKSNDEKPFSVCFEIASEVMEHGSGKSVACAVATAIHALCTNAFENSNDAQAILNHYFESVLFSIYATPEIKMSKIRRNPEHRLTINAIVTAETHLNRVFLKRSMSFILDVLDNPFSGNSAKAAALHTLEILVSNSSIQNETFEYVSLAAICTINEFSSTDWNVKNGAIQVLQALVNRLIGQKNNLTQRRRNGMDDLLILYPDLMIHCHKQMYGSITQDNLDSTIAILALFSESFYTSYNIFNDRSISFIVESFQNAFIRLIHTNANVGVFATKAYVALHSLTNISTVLCDIVEWIKKNFDYISKNVFATVISLLLAFLNKFNTFFMSKKSDKKVNRTLLDLKLFLRGYNCKYEFSLFNMLAFVTYDVLQLKDKIIIILRSEETYETRLWLNTNLPYVLNNVGIEEYPLFLRKYFGFQLSITLLRHCVDSVVNRYSELVKYSLIESVLCVFINKFIRLESTNYILVSFCETILLLLEGSLGYSCCKYVVLQLREQCVNSLNIYTLSIYLALLSSCINYVEEDELFLRNAIKLYTYQVAKRDSELQIYAASTLIFLYNSINISQRSHVLKMSFILLLTPESTVEISKFLAVIFKQNLSNTYETLISLLSVKNLLDCLQSSQEVAKFLNKLNEFVNTLGDEFEDCGMFYMKQNDHICSYKKCLLKILKKQIETVVKMC